jgi:folate-binding protein YgfZ
MAVTDRIAADYEALTAGCGLLDRSERGKLALTGAGAAEFLNGLVSNDVEALEPERGVYAAVLSPKGKMLGDLRVLRTPEGELLLDTERTALQEVFNVLWRGRIGYDVEIHKRTLETALLSLIGPGARTVAGAESPLAEEHDHAAAQIDGVPVRLVATDLGVDVLCGAPEADRVAAALRERAVSVSEEAVEAVRVETGRPRYGIDLDDSVIPQEAGLNERAVSFTKGCYVGQETVARLHYRGKPNRRLLGLRLSGAAATGDELRLGERAVGRLGTVAVSPRLGPIALALVRREAGPGDTLAVGAGATTAQVVELPFEA